MPQYFGKVCTYKFSHTADCIGAGSFGSVFRATIKIPGEYTGALTVAVKEIHLRDRDTAKKGSNKENFRAREWQSLLALEHDNIVPYHRVEIIESYVQSAHMCTVQLMMDYYPDGDLAGYLRKQHEASEVLPLFRMTDFGRQIANGVNYLHSRKVIHTDLKPANVLMQRENGGKYRLRIGDLDDRVTMKRSFTTEEITHLRGTARFMSPEMVKKFTHPKNSVEPGRGTDVWSIGVIILELGNCCLGVEEIWLHRRKVLKGFKEEIFQANGSKDDQAVMYRIADGFVPLVPERLRKDLAEVINQCFDVDPKLRISPARVSERLGTIHAEVLRDPLVLIPEAPSRRFGLPSFHFSFRMSIPERPSWNMGIPGPVQPPNCPAMHY